MISVHVFAPALTNYLVDHFGLKCEGAPDNAMFELPTHFLTILPEDGWDVPLWN